jgi:hypothetical protein
MKIGSQKSLFLNSFSLFAVLLSVSGCVLKPSSKFSATNQDDSTTSSLSADSRLEAVNIDPSSIKTSVEKVQLAERSIALAHDKVHSFVCYVDSTTKKIHTSSPVSFGAVLQRVAAGDFGAEAKDRIEAADKIFLAAIQSVIQDFADIAANDGTGDADKVPLETLKELWKASSARQAFMETVFV